MNNQSTKYNIKLKIKNNITKKNIYLNPECYQKYTQFKKNNNKNIYIYQSISGREKGVAKFTTEQISKNLITDYGFYTHENINKMIDNYTPVHNEKFNKNIWMNDTAYKIYISDKYKGQISYQTPDMATKGDIRFITQKDYELIIKNGNEIKKLLSSKNYGKCIIETPTIADFYKMYRNNDDKYKYIYQLDPITIKNIEILNYIAQSYCNRSETHIFIPYIDDINWISINNNSIRHPKYTNIYILGDNMFIQRLYNLIKSNIISKNDIGHIIYRLDNMFKLYNNSQITFNDDSRRNYQKHLWGYNNNSIINIIKERNNTINKLKNNKHYSSNRSDINMDHCDTIRKELLEKLSDKQTIIITEEDKKNIDDKLACVLSVINISELENNINNEKILDVCNNYIYSIEDNPIKPTIHNCNKIFEQIKDNILLNKIKKYYDKFDETYKKQYGNDYSIIIDKQLGIYNRIEVFGKKTLNDLKFDIMLFYMPEWLNSIHSDKFDDAFSNRQLILGDFALTWNLQRCSLITRADPFIGLNLEIPNIEWNPEINKVVISCVLNNKVIFPIRIIGNITNVDKYYYLNTNDNNKIYLGNLLLRNKGGRLPVNKLFNVFVYYDKNTKNIRLANFRGNWLMSGEIYEHVRILYIELNIIKHAYDDIGIKFFIYQYSNTTTYFVSRYKPHELKLLYENIDYFKDKKNLVEQLLNNLTCFELDKDINKKFILKPYTTI